MRAKKGGSRLFHLDFHVQRFFCSLFAKCSKNIILDAAAIQSLRMQICENLGYLIGITQ